jgi:hypothetical protein
MTVDGKEGWTEIERRHDLELHSDNGLEIKNK